jgi:hypothetical protein
MNEHITAHAPAWPAPVLLVTTSDCHFCTEGKVALERLGRDYPLVVEEIALASPRGQELATRHGVLFPPGLFLDGACVGFGRVSERKLRRLLEQRARHAPLPQSIGG